VWDIYTARSAAPLGISPQAWRRTLDASYYERATGALGDLPATFRELARRNGVEPSDDALAAAVAARLESQRELLTLRPDAIDVLTRVRAVGLRVGVLSDCTIELAQNWDELPLAPLVDARVLSCEQGRRKPDPELFLLIASLLAVAPEDCLYVGDGGGNELTGASGCGMRAVLLRADDWHTSTAHDREVGWQGEAVSTLSQVLTLLDAG
jgi:putative hydrolase of the HAD superfamily